MSLIPLLLTLQSLQAPLPRWHAEERVRIGSIDDDRTAFEAVVDIAVGPAGRVYVLDRDAGRIAIFSPEGHRLGSVGRRGGGPGEFAAPEHLGWLADTLWVEDAPGRRLTFFHQGGAVRTVTFHEPHFFHGQVTHPWPGPPFADGTLLAPAVVSGNSLSAVAHPKLPIYQATRSGEVIRTLAALHLERKVLRFGRWGAMVEQPVGDHSLFDVAPEGSRLWLLDRVAARTATEAEMHLYALSPSGDTVVDRAIPYRPVPLTEEEFERRTEPVLDAIRESGIGQSYVAEVERAYAELAYRPPFLPPASALVAGADGTVWIGREDMGEEEKEWLVASETGELLATVRLPGDFALMWATRTTLWGVRRGVWDEEYVVRFDVTPVRR